MDHCFFLKLRYLQLVEFQYNCVHHVCVCYDATGKETYTLTQTSIMSWRNSFNELKKEVYGKQTLLQQRASSVEHLRKYQIGLMIIIIH